MNPHAFFKVTVERGLKNITDDIKMSGHDEVEELFIPKNNRAMQFIIIGLESDSGVEG